MATENSPEPLPSDPEGALAAGLEQLGLVAGPAMRRQLLEYQALLVKWNRAYNLTAVRDPRQMIYRHLLDSLAVAPYIGRRRYIDVGTGAGLPGVPLAILLPGVEFHLLDSNGKKIRFLFQVKTALGLDNMIIHHERVEAFHPDQCFDGVLSRAFASLADMIRDCRHLLVADGRFLAMKGTRPQTELAEVDRQYQVLACHQLQVPGLNEQRHLVELAPTRGQDAP